MILSRPSAVLIALLVIGFLLPQTPLALAGQDAGAAADLPGALPRPGDLAAIGLDGFVSGVGATGGAGTLDRFDALYRGAGTLPILDRGEMERGSVLVLVRETELDSPSPDRVIGSVARYPDASEAGAAAQGLIDARAALDGAEIVTGEGRPTGDGDAPTTVLLEGNDPLGSPDYRQASAIGVIGDTVVEVAVAFTGADDPSVDAAAALFTVVGDRLMAELADDLTPGTGIPELVGDGVDPDVSRYVVVDGAPVPVAGRDDSLGTVRAERFAGYGADRVLEFAYRSGDGNVTVGGYVSAHATEDDARAYLADIPDILRADDSLTDVRTGNDIVRVGVGATLLTYTVAADDDIVVTELVVRFDTLVVELIVSAPGDVPAADMTTLGESVETCVVDGECVSLDVPDDLALPATRRGP